MTNAPLSSDSLDSLTPVSDDELDLVSGGREVPTQTQIDGYARYGEDFFAYQDAGY